MKVFEITDYRQIIREFIAIQPKKGRGMIKGLAEYMNVDASYVSQVLSKTRDFSDEQSILVTRFLGLNDLEVDYFLNLVKLDKAGSKILKDYHLEKLEDIRKNALNLKNRVNPSRILDDQDKATFYSSYLYSAIRLFTSLDQGKSLFDVIERFDISHDRANSILTFLAKTGLCDEKDGVYTMGSQHTHLSRGSPFLPKHHYNWRIKALQHSETITEEEIQFTGPVSLSKESFLKVRETLVQAIKGSLEEVKESESEDVACLLIDWFWLKK